MGQRDSLCHSSFLHLFQDSRIESRVHGDCICILASFLMDIAVVPGAGLHMATGECGSSTQHLPHSFSNSVPFFLGNLKIMLPVDFFPPL